MLVLMYILSPIAYPIAKLLDWALGKEGPSTYKKAELKSFLQFHRNTNVSSYVSPTNESPLPLTDEEIGILNGVLSLSEKKVTDIMTPMEVCAVVWGRVMSVGRLMGDWAGCRMWLR